MYSLLIFCSLFADPATDLVRDLGSNSFRQREQTEGELMKLGLSARPALEAGTNDADTEVRERCRRLLPLVIEKGLKDGIERLLADTANTGKHDLPRWAEYAKAVGNDPASKEFFAAMMLKHPAQTALLDDPKALAAHFAERLKEIAREREVVDDPDSKENAKFRYTHDLAELSFWVVAFTQEAPRLALRSLKLPDDAMLTNIRNRQFKAGLDDPKRGPIVEKILAAWMASLGNGEADREDLLSALTLIRDRRLNGMLPSVRRAIDPLRKGDYASMVALALIGEFGNAVDIPTIAKYLSDRTTKISSSNTSYDVQARDVALASTLRLQGISVEGFGFSRAGQKRNLIFSYQLGFDSEKQRERAFEMYADWLRK